MPCDKPPAAPSNSGLPPLRFITCGSVDDGKSTLIGRLLQDTGALREDELRHLARDSREGHGLPEGPDLALLVDGLEAEREQGITIDVAYRFFSTPERSFIVADTPGHEQYTRNMATGASTADAAIILLDARKGVLPQTKRHSYICSLLGIRHLILAVNKMDAINHSKELFEALVENYKTFAERLGPAHVTAVPISALYGDNVASLSARMPWYAGAPLLDILEKIETGQDAQEKPFRFPVQWVNRQCSDFRGLAGTLVSGQVAVGDVVVVAHSGQQSRVARIISFDGDLPRAVAGQAVTLVLEEELDCGRGDMLCSTLERIEVADQFAGHLLWMGDAPGYPGRSYLLRIGTATVAAQISKLKHAVNINTLDKEAVQHLARNQIGYCNISLSHRLPIEAYQENRKTGAFILIDRASNATVAAGMISYPLRRASNVHAQSHILNKASRAALNSQKPRILWFTGLSGAGKSTIADLVEQKLHRLGMRTMLLDGDNLRLGLNKDLGFTESDRIENIRRVGEVAKLFVDAGIVVLCCFISPYRQEREGVRKLVEADEFTEIYVDTTLDECMQRDTKGLYAKVKAGKIKNFTGIDSPYEAPLAPDIHIRTPDETIEQAAQRIVDSLLDAPAPPSRF